MTIRMTVKGMMKPSPLERAQMAVSAREAAIKEAQEVERTTDRRVKLKMPTGK